jgi:hypothetical protein
MSFSPRSSKLAYVIKSYIGDIEFAKDLCNSFCFHYLGGGCLFVLVPSRDVNAFSDATRNLKCKNPQSKIFVVDEEKILQKLNYDIEAFLQISGHEQQQVIKLLFALGYDEYDFYVTLDSDMLIIKDFNDDLFFKKSFFKAAKFKTICKKSKHSIFGDRVNDFLARIFNFNKDKFNKFYYIDAYGLYNAKVVRELHSSLKAMQISNFIEMIKIAPVELEWYGKFYSLKYSNKQIVPIKNFCKGISGFHGSDKFTDYQSDADIANAFIDIKNSGFVATYIHYHTNHRGKTLMQILKTP